MRASAYIVNFIMFICHDDKQFVSRDEHRLWFRFNQNEIKQCLSAINGFNHNG